MPRLGWPTPTPQVDADAVADADADGHAEADALADADTELTTWYGRTHVCNYDAFDHVAWSMECVRSRCAIERMRSRYLVGGVRPSTLGGRTEAFVYRTRQNTVR